MSVEHEPSMNIPEAEKPEEQAFLDESLPDIPDERKHEFLGYLRKYNLTVDEARGFRLAFLNNQVQEFLERRKQTGGAGGEQRKAA